MISAWKLFRPQVSDAGRAAAVVEVAEVDVDVPAAVVVDVVGVVAAVVDAGRRACAASAVAVSSAGVPEAAGACPCCAPSAVSVTELVWLAGAACGACSDGEAAPDCADVPASAPSPPPQPASTRARAAALQEMKGPKNGFTELCDADNVNKFVSLGTRKNWLHAARLR